MKPLRNQQLFKILAVIFILFFLASKSLSINFDQHQQYQSAIVQLQEKDAIFDRDILKSRYQTFTSYDSLVKNLDNLKIIYEKLKIIPDHIQGNGRQEIQGSLSNLEGLIQQKENYVERFKSQNSALKNSLYYLPVLVTQFEKTELNNDWFNPLATTLNNLLYDILFYNLTPNEDLKTNIKKKLIQLSQIKEKYQITEEDFPIELATSHTYIILENKPIVDRLTSQLLQSSIVQSSQALKTIYDLHSRKALKSLNIYRFWTYAWFLSIVIAISYLTIKKLSHLNKQITSLNEKLEEENLRMGAELEVARKLQQMLLPKPEELQSIDGLDIAAFMEPADEVGGDYYDVLYTDGVVTIGIGDVTGHGLESGILMLMTQTGVRTLKEIKESDPVKFLDTLNRTIYRNVQRMNSSRSLTLAILNYARGRVSVSGQHEETLVVRSKGNVERIDTIDLGLPIGLDEEIGKFIDHASVELRPGDGVVLYTDGITEAKDINKNRYGIERLCKIVSQNWQHSAQEIKQAVIEDVRRHIGKQKVFDDITLVVLKLIYFSPV